MANYVPPFPGPFPLASVMHDLWPVASGYCKVQRSCNNCDPREANTIKVGVTYTRVYWRYTREYCGILGCTGGILWYTIEYCGILGCTVGVLGNTVIYWRYTRECCGILGCTSNILENTVVYWKYTRICHWSLCWGLPGGDPRLIIASSTALLVYINVHV